MSVVMSKWMALLVIAIHLSLGWSFSNLPHLSQLSRIADSSNTKLRAWDSYGGLNGDYSSYGPGRRGRGRGGYGGDYYDNYNSPGFSSTNPHSMAEGGSRLFRGSSAGSRYSSYGNDSSMYNNPMRPYGSRYYNDRDDYPSYSYYYSPEDYEYGGRYGRGRGYSINNNRRNRWYGGGNNNYYNGYSRDNYRGGGFGGYGYGGGGYGYGTGYGVRRGNMFDQSGSGYYGTYFNDRYNKYYDSPYFSYYYNPENSYGGYGGYGNYRSGYGGYGNSRYGNGNSRYGYGNSRYGNGNSRYGYGNSRFGGMEGYGRSTGRANMYNRGYRGYMSSPEDDIRFERTRRRFANLQDGDSKLFGNRSRDAVSFDKPRRSNLEFYASPYSVDSRYYDDYDSDYDEDYYGGDGGDRYSRRGSYGGYDSYDGGKPWSLTDEEMREYEGSGSKGFTSSSSGRYSRNSGYSGMSNSRLDTFDKYTPLDEGGSRLFDSSDE